MGSKNFRLQESETVVEVVEEGEEEAAEEE
jgi:hypothetical protein